MQSLWLGKAFHERDLIDANGKKESRKRGQRLFAEVATTIKIVPPGSIGIGEMPFVRLDIAELLSMKKDQLDLPNACVWIPDSKTPNVLPKFL